MTKNIVISTIRLVYPSRQGDDIIVLVGDTYGQNISMQCIWETGTEYKQTASSGDVYIY